MKSEEKDQIMNDFKNGLISVLVSTTVIEVGINVPNATIMVIENADRFGLAELHQLRGRVGRGEHKSYCILISDMKTDISRQRMKIIKDTSNGFEIAEKDLTLRGTGEFFGTRQHGLPELKLADIFKDAEILRATNKLAKELIESGSMGDPDFENLREKVEKKFEQKTEDITFN
jgi:ATP-dependent DNA helicase RecG